MKLQFVPYHLQLKHPFRLATGSRTSTPTVQVRLVENGIFGYGEASMPPYLGESLDSVSQFLSGIDSSDWNLDNLSQILESLDSISDHDNAAKASIDIALHDLKAKSQAITTRELLGIHASETPITAFTIGMGSKDELRVKVQEAAHFHQLKIKLGGPDDKEKITFLRSLTDKPFILDANQGWLDEKTALNYLDFMSTKNVLLVEQPLPVNTPPEIWKRLKEKSSLPIFADESIKRLSDLHQIEELFHGVNIKLMKSTGLSEALKMLQLCKNLGLGTMIGCMTESSCAILAAAQIAPLADFIDLDGPFLITNNPFETPTVIDGKLQLKKEHGNGAIPIENIYPLENQ